jgi:alcohol dehydrogenase (cytochrome c)
VALNADTGKLVWYHQPSPHDTHDWDNVETPVLIEGMFNGPGRRWNQLASAQLQPGYGPLLRQCQQG